MVNTIDLDALVDDAIGWSDLFAGKPPRWTEAQDQFLRDNISYLTDEQMGDELGRSAIAVKLRRQRDLRLPSPSKLPGYMTGQQVALALGVDIHCVTMLVDRGLLPARIMAGGRRIRLIRRKTLLRWAVNPMHWPYFQPWKHDMADDHIRRLVHRKMALWDNEWLTTGQVAELHGVPDTTIARYIRAGKLAAVKWGNWWVKRSDATAPDLVFYRGSGSAQRGRTPWTPEKVGSRRPAQALETLSVPNLKTVKSVQ